MLPGLIYLVFCGILALMIGLILWQAKTGVVLGGDWRPWYRRKSEPKRFWASVLIQSLMVIVVIVGIIIRR